MDSVPDPGDHATASGYGQVGQVAAAGAGSVLLRSRLRGEVVLGGQRERLAREKAGEEARDSTRAVCSLCLLTPFQVPFPHGEEVAWKTWTATASSDVNSLTSRSYWQCHAADGAILSMEPGACDISLSRPQPHTATARACEETVACLALGTSLGTQKADQVGHA